MITSFKIEDATSIKRMFKFEMEYIDMMVTSAGVGIISNTAEMFIQKFFPSMVPLNHEKDICFRVKRSSFLALLNDGLVELYINDFGGVEITFSGKDTPTRKLSFTQQNSDLTQIIDKLSIFQHQKDFHKENLSSLSPHLGWFKNASPVVNIKDGLLLSETPERRIYQKVKCPDLCASVQYIRYLLDYTDEQYFFQNFIVGMSNNVYVILNQQRFHAHNELALLNSLPSSHMMEVSFSEVYKLLKMLPKCDDVLLDFENQTAVISVGNETITTDVKVLNVTSTQSNIKKASVPVQASEISFDDLFASTEAAAIVNTKSEHQMPKIKIDAYILLNIIGAKSERTVFLSIKKKIVQINMKNGLDIAISKRVVA